MNDPIHDRLRRAADDHGRPLRTDFHDLLDRARTGRRRHCLRMSGAAALTAAALVGTTLGVRAMLPDETTRPAADRTEHERRAKQSAKTDPVLSDAEVIRRCLPQLKKYDAYPQYDGVGSESAGTWRLPRERAYAPGDLVALQDRNGDLGSVLCIVPEKGDEQDPVPFSDLQPDASRPDWVKEMCSELFLPEPDYDFRTGRTDGFRDENQPDLRNADLLGIDSAGPVVQAMLDKGGRRYACSLSPITWDAGINGVQVAGRDGYQVWMNASATGASAKSIVGEEATYYFTSAVMPKEAARIEVTLDGGSSFEIDVKDGAYTVMHKEPGSGGVQHYDYRVLDAQGTVLHEGTDRP